MGKTIANKKNVNNKAGYVVKPVAVKDIEKEADFGLSAFDPALDCVFVGVLRMTSMSLRSFRGCEVRMTSPESVS